MNPQRFVNSGGMMQSPNGLGMGGFAGMNNFGSMSGMNGMGGGMGSMNMGGMGGMGNMGGAGGMMNGMAGTINPSAVMNGVSGPTQPNGMSTINPAMISGGVIDGVPNSNVDPSSFSSPAHQQQFNPSHHPNFSAQLAASSPQQLQLMQEKAMARRQAALAGMSTSPLFSSFFVVRDGFRRAYLLTRVLLLHRCSKPTCDAAIHVPTTAKFTNTALQCDATACAAADAQSEPAFANALPSSPFSATATSQPWRSAATARIPWDVQ